MRSLLVAMVGFRFGQAPETRLPEIRAERHGYAQRFNRLAGVKLGDTVLELGSGCGFGTRAIAEVAGRVIAADISPAYLEFARQELADLQHVECQLLDNRDLSFIPDGSVNAVIAVSVFIHFNLYDMHQYLQQFARLLVPGGRVVFDFADDHRLRGWLRQASQQAQFLEHTAFYREDPSALPGLVQWNSAKGVRAVAEMAGFKLRRRRWHLICLERC